MTADERAEFVQLQGVLDQRDAVAHALRGEGHLIADRLAAELEARAPQARTQGAPN